MRAADDPSVSVIVPTYNRRSRLGRLLAALERQHRSGALFEVIVAVDGATDGTAEMLSGFRASYPLTVIRQERRGPAAARNAAIAAATGEVLLFLDDDVVPQDGLFERHLAVHRRDRHAAAVGRMSAPPGARLPPWLDWEAALLDRHYTRILSGDIPADWRIFFTANASVRREDAIAAGCFDVRFTREEDIELAHRLAGRGVGFHFLPQAVVHHDPDRTMATWRHVAFERGRHDYMLETQLRRAERSMLDEWQQRHPINRALARCCVGHQGRTRLLAGALERAITSAFQRSRRLRLLLCSALFNVMYWEGVAQAAGLGAGVWKGFLEPSRYGPTTNSSSAKP
jgi:glycosyltransferase involved in cell wall biosynthesis